MHIDNTYLTNRPVAQPEETTGTADASRRTSAPSQPPSDASSHVRSAELLQLLAQVKQPPEVRPDVLARVAERLASGHYLTRDAAEQTAGAIQGAQE